MRPFRFGVFVASIGLVVLGAASHALAQCKVTQLQDPDETVNDGSGERVRIEGSFAFIGAKGDYDSVPKQVGSIYLFEVGPSGWVQTGKLFASDATEGDAFGASFDVDGDHLIVGAPGDDVGANSSGSAYAFERIGGQWVQTQKLALQPPIEAVSLGQYVAMSGNRAVVLRSAPGFAASAEVCERGPSGWTFTQTLLTSTTGPFSSLNRTCAIDGDVIALTYPNSVSPGLLKQGYVFVFERMGPSFVQTQILAASDAMESDQFGSSVHIDGDRMAIGAGGKRLGSVASAGAVYIFERQGGTWVQVDKIPPPEPTDPDGFGGRVRLHGDTLVVSGTLDVFHNVVEGGVWIYRRIGGTWTKVAKLNANGVQTHEFGFDLDVEGDRLIVGESACCIYTFVGKAFVYSLTGATQTFGSGCAGSGGFTPTLAITGCPAPLGTVQLSIKKALGQSTALVLFGLGPTAMDLGNGCLLQVAPMLPSVLLLPLNGAGPGTGTATVSSVVSYGHVSGTFAAQAFVFDASSPLGVVATNGVQITIP